jgi:MraZ protein
MLRGSYNARVDDKGRIKVPAAFKRYLDEIYGRPDFYVTSLLGDCARIYPLREWEGIEKKLSDQPSMIPAAKKFLDRANYYGQMQEMDAQGRILIYPMLRNEARLSGEVMVFGYLKYLEVWNAENFRRSRLEEQPYTDEDAAALAQIGI